MNKPLIIVAGPTAVGKSEFSVKLAKKINGEIISADSMQVYKGMDIGSAKITEAEMQGIKHYLIDVCEPSEEFNVVVFKEMAMKAIEEIYSHGKIPIVAGGTGFYIQALLYDIDFSMSQGQNAKLRECLSKEYHEKGPSALFEKLKEVDPKTAEIIHMNDEKRVIRALEFFYETNTPISLHNETEYQRKSDYNFCFFVLNDERASVYERIDKRVDKMIEKGLVFEVKTLKDLGYKKEDVSMQGLGYKEILRYLEGEISLSEAIYIIKRDSRHFAKRQITWFKREKDVTWINRNDFMQNDEKMLQYALNILKEKHII